VLGDDVLGGAQQALGEAQGAFGVDAVERGREVGRHDVEARRGPAAGGGVPAARRPRGEREAKRGRGWRAWPGGAGRCSERARTTQPGCGAQRLQPWTMCSVSMRGQPSDGAPVADAWIQDQGRVGNSHALTVLVTCPPAGSLGDGGDGGGSAQPAQDGLQARMRVPKAEYRGAQRARRAPRLELEDLACRSARLSAGI